MELQTDDIRFAQIALARGLIELPRLLKTATLATSTGQRLEDRLVEDGVLEPDEVRRLNERLEEMSAEEHQQLVSQGETIALQTIQEESEKAADSLARQMGETLDERGMSTGEDGTFDDPFADSPAAGGRLGDVPSTAIAVEEQSEARDEPDTDRYELLEELGRGGMGRVVKARDGLMDREIALKTVRSDASVERPRQRLLSEARLTGRLEHPNIVPVYELGQRVDDEPYYTMRVVPDRSLEMILDERRDGDPDSPSLLHLIQILRQVCLAVEFAHKNGVVHRDLKPENILVGDYGEVFVIDWGVAKVLPDQTDLEGPMAEADHEPGALVGTPRYMSPEQAHGDHEEVDEQSDVYALGAILYEILTLSPIFERPTAMALLVAIASQQPEPPSERAPDREIPEALEEICLRAVSKDPSERYPSCQVLAEELELFIEGAKQRERERQKARQLLEEAHEVRRGHRRARRRLQEAIAARDKLRETTATWAGPDDRAELWEAEDRVEDLQVAVQQKFNEAVRRYGQSLGHHEFDEAHDALAEMYWDRFVEAEKRGDREMASHFEHLVRQHDTGKFAERLEGRARLSVEISVTPNSTGVELKLWRLREQHRRLVPGQLVATGEDRLNCPDIPHGRYRLTAEAPGCVPIRRPVLLERGEHRELDVRMHDRDEIPEDFAVIPAGEFLSGSPDEFGLGDNEVEFGEFAIQKHPVTCAEYVEFLNDLADEDLEKARRHAPRTSDEADSYFPLVDGKFQIPERDPDGDVWEPQWPIFIVNYHDATAYAQWRSRREGRTYRLPTSREWEKAARGVDGRLYPWGDHFDPLFCRMRQSTPDKAMPAPVGSHPVDTSPYGVRDMAGNISEWTATEHENSPGIYVLRGGSFNSFPLMCRLDWYLSSPAEFRHSHYGFRLVLELD